MASVGEMDFLPFGLNSTPTFVLSIVSATFVALLTVVKILVTKLQKLQFFASDFFAVVASLVLLSSLGLIIFYNAVLPPPGTNPPDPLDQPESQQRVDYLKAVFAVEILWSLTLGFGKLSILLLFRRVFTLTKLRVVTVCTMLLVVSLYTSMVFGTIFQCSPVRSFWHRGQDGQEPKCFDRQLFFLFSSIPNIVVNTIILVLPIYELRRLEIRRTVKIFMWAIFMLGCFALGASIARFVEIAQIGGPENRPARIGGGAAVIVETTFVILCAYLPTLCPALWRMRPFGNKSTRDSIWSALRRLVEEREAKRLTGGSSRKWPRSRPRPYSEFIDPTKPLPREPRTDYMRSLGSLSALQDSSLRGGIRVERNVTTTVERRSQFLERHPEMAIRSFDSW